MTVSYSEKKYLPPKTEHNIFVYGEHFRSCSLAYVLSLGQINSYLKKNNNCVRSYKMTATT